MANSIFARCDDSGGRVGDVIDFVLTRLGPIAEVAGAAPDTLADPTYDALIANDYGQYRGVIEILAPALYGATRGVIMNAEKYDRNVSLLCPTCGSTQFEYDETLEEGHAMVCCTSCDREMTKDELIHENSENINEHMEEIGKKAVDDIAKDMRKSLKKAFSGNKNIKIK